MTSSEMSVCKICRREYVYSNRRNSRNDLVAFEERGRVCGKCAQYSSKVLSTETSSAKSLLNEKYISCFDRLGKTYYRVKIKKNRSIMNRSFDNLDQAIRFRDIAVEFYNLNGRLPNHDEQNIIFPERQTYKKNTAHKDDSKSTDSSTGLKHISFNSKLDRFIVDIIRNSKQCAVSFKDLDDAIAARDLILSVYHETGKLPSRGEVIAKIDEISKKTCQTM